VSTQGWTGVIRAVEPSRKLLRAHWRGPYRDGMVDPPERHRSLWPGPADALVALALLAVVLVDVWWPEAAVWGDDPLRGPNTANALLLGAAALAVAWRRTAPLAATAAASTCFAVQAMVSGDPPIGVLVSVPVLLLVYALGAYSPRLQTWAGIALVAAAIAVHDVIDVRRDPEISLNDASWWWLVILFTWLAGRYVGTRRRAREQTEGARRREEELVRAEKEAVTSERLRIAGELHDAVAHNISVVALQAGAALELLDTTPERAREPLLAIEATARSALEEMGTLVGVLRTAGEATVGNGLATLPELADRVSCAGLPVRLGVGELPKLPPGIDLSAYRIVQEALTNALRHAAGATHVDVSLEAIGNELRIRVADDGNGPGAQHPTVDRRAGHGLVGMRERALAFHGSLTAGPGGGGGFVVEASLPITEASSG
jgi:signal transduction histidine kinase